MEVPLDYPPHPDRPGGPDFRLPACFLLLMLAASACAAAGEPGEPSWVMQYPDCGSCEAHAVSITQDGGYVITGSFLEGGGRTAILLQKADNTGTIRWSLKGDGDSCEGNALTAAGAGIIAAAGGGCNAGAGSATLTVTDEGQGKVVRSNSYDPGRNATGTAVISTGDGGYLLVEETGGGGSSGTGRDIVIRRLDLNGATLWSRAFSGPFDDTARAAAMTSDGGFIIAGSTVREGSVHSDILLIRLGPDGSLVGTWTPGTGETDETTGGIALTGDGGYLVAGTSCGQGGTGCDIYAIRTGAAGTLVWENRYGGSGRDRAAAVIPAPDGGYIIAGTSDSPDLGAADRDIYILKIDGSGRELWNRTFGSAAYDYVTGTALTASGSLIITGYTTKPVDDGTHTLLLISAGRQGMDPPAGLLAGGRWAGQVGGIRVIVRDAITGAGIPGAQVYLDGKLAGSTSPESGSFAPGTLAPGGHSVRVVLNGYRETTIMISGDQNDDVTIRLQPSPVHRISGSGTTGTSLDIVFIPSDTTYDCSRGVTVPGGRYTGNPGTFLADVQRLMMNRLIPLERYTIVPSQIPADYQQRLNIYYYWDGEHFGDAFDGCAGRLPDGFYDEAPYTDVAVILYPDTAGSPSDGSCDPAGCASAPGPGPQVYLKAPAGQGAVFLHEGGHTMFGLMDTYAGPTYYTENLPSPNIWGSAENCSRDAATSGWNASLCRSIGGQSGGAKEGYGSGFWKYDPDPDLMGSTAITAKFGDASTRRIRYVLDAIRSG